MSNNYVANIIQCHVYFKKALSQLVVLSDSVCPGHELRLECTVVGVGTTIWRGSAFSDCSGNRIVLRHSQFERGTSQECNNDRIMGRSINTTSDSDGIKYISQLIIQLDENGTLDGRTVECVHISGAQTTIIGTHTIIACTRGITNVDILKLYIHRIQFCSCTYTQTLPHLLKMSIYQLTGID